jgi:hypothetical protein
VPLKQFSFHSRKPGKAKVLSANASIQVLTIPKIHICFLNAIRKSESSQSGQFVKLSGGVIRRERISLRIDDLLRNFGAVSLVTKTPKRILLAGILLVLNARWGTAVITQDGKGSLAPFASTATAIKVFRLANWRTRY